MYTLYQFPFSHFCEKARWALAHKQQPYRAVNLLPGLHSKVTARIAPKTCMPIIEDQQGVVTQGSSEIIDKLDQCHPESPLTPVKAELAERSRQWEAQLDEHLGVPIRLWFYHHTLPDRQRAMGFLLLDSAWYGRPLMAAMFPKVRQVMLERMNINDMTAEKAEQQVVTILDQLDARLTNHEYLVGDQFSRADLTAASLISPMLRFNQPINTFKARYVPVVQDFYDQLQHRPVYEWAEKMYVHHRDQQRI